MTDFIPESDKRKAWADDLNLLEYETYYHENGQLVQKSGLGTLQDTLDQAESVLGRWAIDSSFKGMDEDAAIKLAKEMQDKGNSLMQALQDGNRPQKRDFIQLTKFLNDFAAQLTYEAEKTAQEINSGEATNIDKHWGNPRDELIGKLRMMAFHDDFSGNKEQAEASYLEEARFNLEVDMSTLSQTNSALGKLGEIAKDLGWSAELGR